MSKTYIGNASSVSRQSKKIYFSPAGVAQKVKKAYLGDDNDIAQLVFSSGWTLGAEVLSGTATGQTSSIRGYDSYTFTEDTGVIALSGSQTYHTLASLLSSGKPVYTAVSSDTHTLTLKRVTDSSTSSSTSYSQGSWSSTSKSSAYDDTFTVSGATSYSFNSTTGKYSVSGSGSDSLTPEDDDHTGNSYYSVSSDGKTLTEKWGAVEYPYGYIYTRTRGVTSSTSTSTTYTVKTYTQTATE